MVKKHLSLLGMPCKDRVTGMEGVITSVSFDLYGCIQAVVQPGLDGQGQLPDSRWFDVLRLEITSDTPKMPTPNFDFGHIAEGLKGPEMKPAMIKV